MLLELDWLVTNSHAYFKTDWIIGFADIHDEFEQKYKTEIVRPVKVLSTSAELCTV